MLSFIADSFIVFTIGYISKIPVVRESVEISELIAALPRYAITPICSFPLFVSVANILWHKFANEVFLHFKVASYVRDISVEVLDRCS